MINMPCGVQMLSRIHSVGMINRFPRRAMLLLRLLIHPHLRPELLRFLPRVQCGPLLFIGSWIPSLSSSLITWLCRSVLFILLRWCGVPLHSILSSSIVFERCTWVGYSGTTWWCGVFLQNILSSSLAFEKCTWVGCLDATWWCLTP